MRVFRMGNAGFSMVEILVATTLGLAGIATIMSFNRTQFLSLEDQAKQIDLQTTSRSIVDVVSRELRRAGMDPACTKAFNALADASATQVRVQEDLNSNGTLEAASEDLTYRIIDNSRLERVAGQSAEVLLDGADFTGSRFRYFDGAGNELVPAPSLSAAQRASVRRMRIELAVSARAVNPGRSQPLVARAATDVEVRNRFFVAVNTCP